MINREFLLDPSTVIPAQADKVALTRADKWMRNNPAKETDLDELETKLGVN